VPVLKFDMRQLTAEMKALGPRMLEAAHEGAYVAAMRGIDMMHRETRAAPPANPAGKGRGGAVNTGAFIHTWKAARTNDGARTYNASPYAAVIEHGRRKGSKAPPRDAIVAWLMRRLGKTKQEAESLQFVVRRAIAKRGLKPRRIAESSKGRFASMAFDEIERHVREKLGARS